MSLLPFNFEKLDNDTVFLSNMAGFHAFLNEQELRLLIDNGSTGKLETDNLLESRLFTSQANSTSVAAAALGSALAKRISQEIVFRPIFMIVPTLRCDHSCRYCQVSRASISADAYDMEEEWVPYIIESIRRLSSPPYKLEIQGGEPLLRFDLVKAIYQQAESSLGIESFEMVIATSLSLLNDDVLYWAKDRRVLFSTSLDGDALVHNQNRLLPTKDSFQRVTDGVRNVKRILGENRVSTVTTVTDELIKRPEALVDAHHEIGLDDLFVRPISPYGFSSGRSTSSYSIDEYLVFYNRLLEVIKEKNNQGSRFVEHSAVIHLKRLFTPGFSHYADLKSPSGVVLNCILFNYDGLVFGSDESRMLQKKFKEVNFSAGPINKIDFLHNDYYRSVLSQSFTFSHPGCESCAFQPFCGSDPCQSISVQGEPVGDKSLSTFCHYHKGMFHLLLNHIHAGGQLGEMLMRWIHV